MKKFKKIATQAIAFSSALSLTFTGLQMLAPQKVSAADNSVSITGTSGADTFSWDNALVYFLLTDRFKNGNTSNDHSYNRGLAANGSIVDINDDRATFHGGDFAGVTDAIEEGYFDNLGVNAIWISAPYEQVHGYIVGDNSNPSYAHYSYHGYYVSDYTQTDANFGTAAEFKEMVDTAHEHGIRVVLDVVLNHAGYNSIYDMNEYGFGGLKSGWENYYYNHNNVNNTDYHSYIDYSTENWSKWWGGAWIRAGLPGGYTEGGNDELTQSLTGLPDFKTESKDIVEIPEFLATKWKKEGRYDEEVAELKKFLTDNGYQMTVTNCISYWLSTWVREYGIDGFRCDTAKHVELDSWRVLHDMCTDALKEWKTNNPDKKLDDLDFWMTGEAWGHTVNYDGYYTTAKFDSMINFETSGGNGLALNSVASKYASYASQINSKDDFNVLSYISSHDSTLGRGDLIYTGSAFLLLPGGVQIFYGDETNRQLVPGVNNDGNGGAGHSLRSDMNWNSMDKAVLEHWQKVGTFRSSHIAVGAGAHNTVNATSGVGFTRTYSKNGITDRVAACIGAAKNTSVTIDVSGVWNDGEEVINCYDGMTDVVVNGKVTFNSGDNGTILISDIEENGKPRVTISGASSFTGTQEVTINVKNADYAIVSVDGAKKFKAYDGDKITIGETAYEGDTVLVSYKAVNEEGTTIGTASFYKNCKNDKPGDGEVISDSTIVKVKMSDGSAPYLHAWNENGNLTGKWPGIQFTQKDSDGYYYMELDTVDEYNVVFNDGANWQTDDIKELTGSKAYHVDKAYFKDNAKGVLEVPVLADKTIKITVKPHGSTAPYLYIWNGSDYPNGTWPGKQLTQKDNKGNYVFTVEGYEFVNCIVNDGDKIQSGNIEGIIGDCLITVKAADYSSVTIEPAAKIDPKLEELKQIIREVKNMTSKDYTSATWNALYEYVDNVDALVAAGENADVQEINAMYDLVVAAKDALVLAMPKITSASAGSKTIKGTAACEAEVSVTVGGNTYTAVADELTGVWYVTLSSALTASTKITYSAVKTDVKSANGSYTVSGSSLETQLNGLCKGEDGNWYYYKNNVVDTSYTGMAKNAYGVYYVKAGKLDRSYTGMYLYSGKWVYVNSGKYDTSYTGMAKNSAGWWYMKNGVLDRTYTGMAKNQYGVWYMKAGKLDTTYTGMYLYEGKWIYVNAGKYDTEYTGMAKNSAGVWYMKNGELDRTYTGMYIYDGKWVYVNKGKYDTTYTGMAKNSAGWWYMKNGVLDRTYTGMAKNSYGVWYMKAGKLDRSFTGMCLYNGKWVYVNEGKYDTTYTGIAKNSAGWWYMKNGVLDRTYTGKVTYQGKTYNVTNGKVAK